MRYRTHPGAEPNLTSLDTAAQKEQVFTKTDQQPVAVLVSAREYERLSNGADVEFQEFCDLLSDRAASRGITEAKLDMLLTDD